MKNAQMIGFHDGSDDMIDACGLDVLGAAPAARRPAGKPGARAVVKAKSRLGAMAQAKASAEYAYKVGKAVVDAGKATLNTTSKTKVAGAAVLMGAVAKKPLTARQKAAAAKYEAAMKRSREAANAAVARGQKAMAHAQAAAKSVVQQAKIVAALRGKRNPIVGDDTLDFGNFADDGSANAPTQTYPLDYVFRKVPGDATVYDGALKGWPSDCFASYNVFYGTASKDGFIWTDYRKNNKPYWWARRGGAGKPNGIGSDWAAQPDITFLPESSIQFGWGPIIGNPSTTFAGLRYAIDDKQWFFPANQAPDWATAEARAAIDLLNKQAAEAEEAAAEAEKAEADRQAAERQRAQDEQDFKLAMQEKEEQSRAAVEASQQAGQQAQVDIEERKAALEAAKQQAQYAPQGVYPQYADQGGPDFPYSYPGYGDDPNAAPADDGQWFDDGGADDGSYPDDGAYDDAEQE